MSSVRFTILSFLAFLITAGPAYAFGIDLKKIPTLKDYEFGPEAEFQAATKLVTEKPAYNDEYLPYELRLPKDWTDNVQQSPIGAEENKSKLSNTVPAILGRYIGAPKNFQRSRVTVEALTLDHEISATDWFVDFMVRNGSSLSGLSEKSARELEALYIHVETEDTFVVYARVLINGPRLFLVRHYLPQDNYDEDKQLQARIIKSFRLTNNTKERIEKQVEHGFLDQSYFNYPASWKLKERSVLSIERMMALLYQESADEKESRLDGHIRINVVSKLLKTTLAQEIERFNKETKIPGYKVGSVIETISYKHDPSIKLGKTQAYTLIPDDPAKMKDYEFIVSVMEGADYYYIVSLITPSREQDFYMWARNMEAFQIVAESTRRSNVLPAADKNDPYYDFLKE